MAAREWVPHPDPSTIVVPGLDPNAPVTEQLELMDQLITLRLQNVDAIFADIHSIIIGQLLPSIKRYSMNTQPTREAAHYWKTFFEIAANVKVPMPGGEPSVPEEEQHTAPSDGDSSHHTEEKTHESHDQASFSSDRTPANYSFDPVLSSTPAHGAPVDSTTTSSTSSDVSFPAFLGPGGEKLLDINLSLPSAGGAPRPSSIPASDQSYGSSSITSITSKGKGKLADITSSSSISNVFSNTPSPKKAKAITPKRPPLPPNPFMSSTVKAPWDGIVDLAHYSSATSDSSISFGLSPELKMKYFSTPQYKLMRSTTEEAVAIRMAETKARLPSESSQDESLPPPPTPMSAAKRAKQLREIRERHSVASGGWYRSNLLRDDDDGGGGGEFYDDDSSLESDDYASTSAPPRPSYGGGVDDNDLDSDSDSDFEFDGNESGNLPAAQHSYSNSDSGSSDHNKNDGDNGGDNSAQVSLPPRPIIDDDTSQVVFDHTATGPTETIFGVRPGIQISAAQFERNLGKALNARMLPNVNPLDSPTPGMAAPGRRPSGPSNPRNARG
ncbi:hypothetical protein BS47DRAFT_1399980 [Hydnum rufescens UP504]|uniref:DASH complex subunit ASK1 n=1 Tax=Hydnum rufescens UP504 TaxID=1448309 RepID=A0A9P6AHE8_9AGAM|nr:hypothetical protein BS47DRAFT_1399980 [Hydnum rufescens UP504]